jgi:hypothetical protein
MEETGTRRSWIAALALAALGCTAPFLVADFPPSTDLPQHVAQIRLLDELAGLAPASPMMDEPIAVNWIGPGNLVYAPMWLLARALPPLEVGKAALWLLLLGNIAAIFRVAALRGKPPWLALLASVFTFNLNAYWGFVGFLLGAPLFLLWVHAVSRASMDRVRRADVLRIGLLALAIYGAHSLWFLAAAAWMGAATLIARPRLPVAISRLAAVAPVCVLAAVWFPMMAEARAASGFDTGVYWLASFQDRVDPTWLVDSVLGGLEGTVEPVFAGCALAWIALSLWMNRGGLRAAVDWPLAATGLGILLVMYAGPDQYMNSIFMCRRFAPTAAILLLLAVPPPRIRPAVCWIVSVAFALTFFAVTATAWYSFNRRDVSGLGAALAAVEKPGPILGLDFRKRSEFIKWAPFLQLAAYAQAKNGSVPAFSFAQHNGALVHYTRRRASEWTGRLEWFSERVRDTDFSHFDYVLVTAPDRLHDGFVRNFDLRPLTRTGGSRLYATDRDKRDWLQPRVIPIP